MNSLVSLSEAAQFYALYWHRDQLYDNGPFPFAYHLEMVQRAIDKHKALLGEVSQEQWQIVLAAGRCHDLMEDTAQKYGDIAQAVGKEVADIVLLLTDEKAQSFE